MFLSVIIPTRGRAEALKQTLDSLAEQWPEGGGVGCELIVVGDGIPAIRALARDYSAIPVEWIFEEGHRGLPAARNSGASKAHGEILLFLNDDTPAAPGLLDIHLDAHQRRARASETGKSKVAVCGRVVESAAEQCSKTGQMLQEISAYKREDADAALADTHDTIPADSGKMSCFGLNCSIARELFEAAGGFNPALCYMDGEMEFGCRLYARGVYFVCEPGAIIFRRTTEDLVEQVERDSACSGSDDVLRAVKMEEHNSQTRQLLAMDTGPVLSRMVNRAFWYGNGPVRGVSAFLQKVTERTGWRGSLRLWHESTQRQRYWQAVRQAGIGREQLKRLKGHPLRVILLHSIGTPQTQDEASYCLTPAHFRTLVDAIKAGGYSCADPAKLEEEGATWGERELVLTFDDGYEDFYSRAFPLLESSGLKPLMFLVADRIGGWNLWDQDIGYSPRRLMTVAQIRELHRHGVRFGSHTLSHPRLTNVTDEQLRRELRCSKQKIEDLLGEAVNVLAYPFGAVNPRVRAAVIEAGYKAAVTTIEGLNLWQDPFSLMRADFNGLVPPRYFAWKLRHGVGPRRSLKEEAMPLLRLIPRRVQEPVESAENQLRSGTAHG